MKVFKEFEMPVEPIIPNNSVNILDFGAVEGGKIKCTNAIKSAIDALVKMGGGKVVFPKGEFLTGPIHFKSNIELHFEEGCYVKFSRDYDDYLPVVFSLIEGIRAYAFSSMLYGCDLENIAITGSGTLDADGFNWYHFWDNQPGMVDLFKAGEEQRPVEERVYDSVEDGVRPQFCHILRSENVLIEGVTFRNSPFWTVHPAWCKNVIVRGITLNSEFDTPNTDSVNIDSCNRVLVEDCLVESGGDDIYCIKAGRNEDGRAVNIPCENVIIRNCRAENTRGGGIVIGSETSAGVKNILAENCTFKRTYNCLRIKTMKGRGGVIENVEYRNLIAEDMLHRGINLTFNYTAHALDNQDVEIANMPIMRNIVINNVKCKNVDGIGLLIEGVKNYPIESVYIEDVTVENAKEDVIIQNAENINIKNLTVI